jgi:hypothetical protein
MSYGSYNPSQVFNPTANTSQSNALGAANNAIQQGNLPGAQDPNNQQYFQQMHQGMDTMGQAMQGMEQQPQGPGGKSFGGELSNTLLGTGGKSTGSPALMNNTATGQNQFRGAQTF